MASSHRRSPAGPPNPRAALSVAAWMPRNSAVSSSSSVNAATTATTEALSAQQQQTLAFQISLLTLCQKMFVTVFGQKGGVAKTCTSIHLASVWAQQGYAVCVVDADRNRSATAYGARGLLGYEVVPVEAAAKATRSAQIVITDGQASSHEDELKNLSAGSDIVVLPTTPQARSVELTIEMSAILRGYGIRHAALLVKVDTRKQRFADEARDTLEGFGLEVLDGSIPLLAAFDKAEVQGVTVREAVDDKGRSDPRRMVGWAAYCAAANQLQAILKADSADNLAA